MGAFSMSVDEKEQLIRLLFTAENYTPLIILKIAESGIMQFIQQPLSADIPIQNQLKARCHTWLLSRVKDCFEREATEEIHHSKTIAPENMLINIQYKIHYTWENLYYFCQQRLSLSETEKQVLQNLTAHPNQKQIIHQRLLHELEKLVVACEVALAPYLQGKKKGVENLHIELQWLYRQMESPHLNVNVPSDLFKQFDQRLLDHISQKKISHNYLSKLQEQLLLRAQDENKTYLASHLHNSDILTKHYLENHLNKITRFYSFIADIFKNIHLYKTEAHSSKNKKELADSLEEKANIACLRVQNNEEYFNIAKDLLADIRGAMPVMQSYHLAEDHLRLSLFRSEATVVKNFKKLIKEYPEFYGFNHQPSLTQKNSQMKLLEYSYSPEETILMDVIKQGRKLAK